LDEIIDHRKTADAVPADDAIVVIRGQERPRRTTKGWQLLVQWCDGSTTWERLKDLKESDPVSAAEYAVANKLVAEPAFSWWVPYTIRKKDRIIKAVNKRYFRRFYKYGLELPKTVERALEIDEETGTTHWRDAIRKEIKNIAKAVRILGEDKQVPVGSTHIRCHIIFDIKMDFTRKARFVAGEHMTDPPPSITYASVVTRESVRIAFTLAALNDLSILSADVQGAYLNAPCRERVHLTCGKEFGEFAGYTAVIIRALYGLKTAGASWRSLLAETLRTELDFTASRADQDVWRRAATKSDGTKYYEYVLVYTDDILAISENPRAILERLNEYYLLKGGTIEEPKQYLGSSISKFYLPDDPKPRWCQGSEQYIKEAVRNVKEWLEARGLTLKTKAPSVLPSGYKPELDVTPYCDAEDMNYYQQQIGVLRWSVELGRIDICAEVSMMASYCAAPRRGHLGALMHVYSYLSTHERSRIVFDDSYPPIPPEPRPDWSDFYPDAREELPPDIPEPRGRPVEIVVFVDADHAGDTMSRRSRTGILIYVNRAPILWMSKKQNSIETSTFGSEFSALKMAVEQTMGLRYKLRMMGVPLVGHAHVRVDNMSVVRNTSAPESQLKKKSNSIAYHFVREAAAADIVRIAYEPSETNLADVLTKTQPGTVRKRKMERILY